PPERRRMGMVFQNYAVWPHMTVLENVAFGLRIAKVDRRQMQERVTRVLAAVGLTGLEARHPGQLSGGQQQRVALSDRIVVFNQGEVQQIGAPREIYERPANLFVADFMGLVNRLPAILIEQAQGTALVRVGPHQLHATIGPDAAAGSGAVTLVIR